MYSTAIAYLLWFLGGFGALGFHRFYLGKIPTGLLWMCTGGLAYVGAIFDFFTLGSQVRDANLRNAMNQSFQSGRGWRYVNDGEARVVREKETVERVILRLAKRNRGIVSPSEVALEANFSIDESKQALDILVNKGIAELRVRKTGTLVYTLPELMSGENDLEDF